MAILEIPVRNDLAAYEFRIVLESVTYFLRFSYNSRRSRWLMDIQNQDKEDVLVGIALLTDVDIRGLYKQEAIPPGLFLVFDTEGLQYNPEQFDLGNRVSLLYEESE